MIIHPAITLTPTYPSDRREGMANQRYFAFLELDAGSVGLVATFSLNNLPAEKAGTVVAGMSIGCPVLGLRPSLACRSRPSKVPNPTNVTFSPSETASMMASIVALKTASACFFVTDAFSVIASTNSPLFIVLPVARLTTRHKQLHDINSSDYSAALLRMFKFENVQKIALKI